MNMQRILQVNVSIKGRRLDTIRFEEGDVSIGREPGSGIFLDNPGVSRQHAKIEFSESGIELIDTRSGNGTFLNEQQIQRSALHNGDTIRIGKFTLEVEISEPPASIAQRSTDSRNIDNDAEQTVFLQAGEQARIMSEARQTEQGRQSQAQPQPAIHAARSAQSTPSQVPTSSAVKIFLAGTIFGSVCTWLFM